MNDSIFITATEYKVVPTAVIEKEPTPEDVHKSFQEWEELGKQDTTESDDTSAKPAQPSAKPAQPSAKPAQPSAKPAQPSAKPAQPKESKKSKPEK